MTGRLVFDLEQIREGNRRFDSFRSELESATKRVRGESVRSEVTFRGESGDRFRELTEEWLGFSKELDAALGALSDWLGDVGDGYEKAHKINRSMFGGS